MEVVRGVSSLSPGGGPTVVTVGFFDGVHRGHQAVLRRTVDEAAHRGAPSVAVTFDRHPREILTPGREPKLLTTLERKSALVGGLGIHRLVVLPFDQEFASWPPDRFVDEILVRGLGAGHVVIGANFTFGYRAMGTLPVLTELGAAAGFTVEAVDLLEVGGRRVSSSAIREAVSDGRLDWPARAMGRRFVLDGTVAAGAGRGTGLGFPTANLSLEPRLLLPGRGVYAGRAEVGGSTHPAALSVGTNPTFGEEALHAEAYLLDFRGDLLGQPIALEFWARLRDEERFASEEALVRQMADDVERTRSLVG